MTFLAYSALLALDPAGVVKLPLNSRWWRGYAFPLSPARGLAFALAFALIGLAPYLAFRGS